MIVMRFHLVPSSSRNLNIHPMKSLKIILAISLMPAFGILSLPAQSPDLALKAFELRMNGHPLESIAFLDSVLKIYPDSARLWFEKGRSMDWIKALECTKFTQSWTKMAPRLRSAKRCFQKACSLDPDNGRYYYWAAEVSSLLSLLAFYSPWEWVAVPYIFKRTIRYAEESVKLSPENPDYRLALINFSRFSWPLGRGTKYTWAQIEALRKIDPVYAVLGSREMATKKKPYNIRVELEKLQPDYPDHPLLMLELARSYSQPESPRASTGFLYYKKLLADNPRNLEALNQMYRRLSKSRSAEVIPVIQDNMRKLENDYMYYRAAGYRLMGQYYQEQGDKDKANEYQSLAEKMNPKNCGTNAVDLEAPGR